MSFTFHILYVICIIYLLKFPSRVFISDILANLIFKPNLTIFSNFWLLSICEKSSSRVFNCVLSTTLGSIYFQPLKSSSFYMSHYFDNTLFLTFPQKR